MIYRYYTHRNNGPRDLSVIKEELIKKTGGICNGCQQKINQINLELEHSIPVSLAGKIFDKENLKIFCIACHSEKTKIDKRVIGILKKLGCIKRISKCEVLSYIEISKLHKLYYRFFKIIQKNNSSSNKYLYTSDIKYIPRHYKENREIKNV